MQHIAILDFGSQYTHLISRNIRELGTLAKIYPHNISAGELGNNGTAGIIISGGPQSVYARNPLNIDPEILNLNFPVLGVCYGHQLIAHMLGGEVKPGKTKEYGKASLEITKKTAIFSGIEKKSPVWMSHGDNVKKIPDNFAVIGRTADCKVTAMAHEKCKIYGFQFHPEVVHTKSGVKMLQNFISLCKIKKDWKVKNLLEDLILKIKKQAGKKKVLVLVSGGVDSSVTFALLTKALGEKRVLGLYIDTGFMRYRESEEILSGFKKIGFSNIKNIDAKEIFFKNLSGITDPEEKRKVIGQTFLDVKDKIGRDLKLNQKEWLLGQGTIYPDTIESAGTKNADKIKTHHNRINAIQKLIKKGLVIEPLVDFYKDEVRSLGKLLGLPQTLVNRHPFPGPGLAIRCLCLERNKNIFPKGIKRKIDSFFKKKYPHIFYTLLSVKSVGVQGDNRTYAHPVAIWGEKNWKKLSEISRSVTNSIKGINRVILLLNPQKKNDFLIPKQKIWLSKKRIETLRKIDAIVNNLVTKLGLYQKIQQFPVVLLPVCDKNIKESIVLRPINSRDLMTLNFFEMERKIMNSIVKTIEKSRQVSYIFYDITDKPPGTVEWE